MNFRFVVFFFLRLLILLRSFFHLASSIGNVMHFHIALQYITASIISVSQGPQAQLLTAIASTSSKSKSLSIILTHLMPMMKNCTHSTSRMRTLGFSYLKIFHFLNALTRYPSSLFIVVCALQWHLN